MSQTGVERFLEVPSVGGCAHEVPLGLLECFALKTGPSATVGVVGAADVEVLVGTHLDGVGVLVLEPAVHELMDVVEVVLAAAAGGLGGLGGVGDGHLELPAVVLADHLEEVAVHRVELLGDVSGSDVRVRRLHSRVSCGANWGRLGARTGSRHAEEDFPPGHLS